MLGCEPPTEDCESCTSCKRVGPGRAVIGADSGGGRIGPLINKAKLSYTAGGAGRAGLPGEMEWRPALGCGWSHSYAQRIIVDPLSPSDPPDSHVWRITETGTYREYGNPDPFGVYETLRPSDDYRTLHRTGSGWELHDVGGTVTAFDNDGRWVSTTDRNGNATEGFYTGDDLTLVTLPDGRTEELAYAGGRLVSVTEAGVGGADSRTWALTWNGDDLVRLGDPDGTAWEMTYSTDPSLPGYLRLLGWIGSDGTSRRVETGFEYDGHGNVTAMWKGADDPDAADAVDVWRFAFDDPADPEETTVTDPLGDTAVYSYGRDPKSERIRLLSIDGDCPTCGLRPNTQLGYGDSAHPLLPTVETDANGNVTEYTYSAEGRVLTRTEAVGTAEERTTTYTYDATYPALVTELSQPSVMPGQLRRTLYGRDGNGNPASREIRGWEAGQPFDCTVGGAPCYETVTTFNAAGQPLSIDPPGYGSGDVTVFTYDSARGSLIADSRTDPLVGTTTFGQDTYNRRTSTTDPNGVTTESEYDLLDRVTRRVQKGASPAEDLVTEHVYDAFGDLVRTILPRGNVIEYGYDAAGRLTTIERKPDAATPAERTVYTLDAAGNRTREDQQRWTGSEWVTEATTSYLYATRCQLDQVLHPDGSITEHAYDCNGNLERTWDANHPSAGQTLPPTATYAYDELDRLVAVTRPWAGAGGGTSVTSYGYDVQDHLTGVTDAEGNTTTYEYSDRDLLTEEVSPVSGTTTHAYNAHGELVETTDARGVTVLRSLDELDRVTVADYPDDTLDTTFAYGDDPLQFNVGRLTSISRDGHTIAYAYDRFGRTTQDGELTYGHDANGNRTSRHRCRRGGAVGEPLRTFRHRPLGQYLGRGAGERNVPALPGAVGGWGVAGGDARGGGVLQCISLVSDGDREVHEARSARL
jgi:YD repeat-containing protein